MIFTFLETSNLHLIGCSWSRLYLWFEYQKSLPQDDQFYNSLFTTGVYLFFNHCRCHQSRLTRCQGIFMPCVQLENNLDRTATKSNKDLVRISELGIQISDFYFVTSLFTKIAIVGQNEDIKTQFKTSVGAAAHMLTRPLSIIYCMCALAENLLSTTYVTQISYMKCYFFNVCCTGTD